MLAATDDPGAPAVLAELERRLQAQLDHLDTAAERRRLISAVPHWAAVVAQGPADRRAAWGIENTGAA